MMVRYGEILWMVAKSCTTLAGGNPINNGIHHLLTGAGFCNHPQYVLGLKAFAMANVHSPAKKKRFWVSTIHHAKVVEATDVLSAQDEVW